MLFLLGGCLSLGVAVQLAEHESGDYLIASFCHEVSKIETIETTHGRGLKRSPKHANCKRTFRQACYKISCFHGRGGTGRGEHYDRDHFQNVQKPMGCAMFRRFLMWLYFLNHFGL